MLLPPLVTQFRKEDGVYKSVKQKYASILMQILNLVVATSKGGRELNKQTQLIEVNVVA